jgi:hypothetical protein
MTPEASIGSFLSHIPVPYALGRRLPSYGLAIWSIGSPCRRAEWVGCRCAFTRVQAIAPMITAAIASTPSY